MKSQEKIEQYISGKLSPGESLLFEAEMLSNPPLKRDYEAMRETLQALQSLWVGNDVRSAMDAWKLRRLLLRAAGAVLGSVLLLLLGWKVFDKTKTSTSNNPEKKDNESAINPATDTVAPHKKTILYPHSIQPVSHQADTAIPVLYPTITKPEIITKNENVDTVFQPEIETFYINNKNDEYITCASGLKVFIPAFSLVNPCGYTTSELIKIEVEDYTGYYNMYKHKITTVSDSNLLESGGSCFIKASNDFDDFQIEKGQHISLLFPAKNNDKTMQIFYGKRTQNGELNWKKGKALSASKGVRTGAFPENPWLTDGFSGGVFHFMVKVETEDNTNTTNKITAYLNQFDRLAVKYQKALMEDSLKLHLNYFISKNGQLSGFEYEKHTKGFNSKHKFKAAKWRRYDRRIMRYGRRMGNLYFDKSGKNWVAGQKIQAVLTPTIRQFNNNQSLEKIDSTDDDFTRMQKENNNYNIITASQFGYINCDHFTTGPLTSVRVPIQNADDDARIFFNHFNAAARLNNENQYAGFKNLPRGESVKLVVIRRHNGLGEMNLSNQTISPIIKPGPFEPYNLEKIRLFLEGTKDLTLP